nr:hypothetical protein [Tanacetum cinerariifolium]
MAVIKSYLGWRFKDFKAERAKRQGIILEKEQVKKQKLSKEASESKSPNEEVSEDRIKEMMQLVPVEDVRKELLADYKIGWQHCLLSVLCRSSKAARHGGSESAMGSSEGVSHHQTYIK